MGDNHVVAVFPCILININGSLSESTSNGLFVEDSKALGIQNHECIQTRQVNLQIVGKALFLEKVRF